MSYKKDVKALREKSRYAFVCQKGKCWGVGDTPGEAYTHARTRVTDFLRKQAGDSSDDTAVLGGWLDLIGKWHPFIARITPKWCEEWKAKLDRLQNVMEIRVDPHRLTTRHSCTVKMLMHDDEMEFKRKCRAVVEDVSFADAGTKVDAQNADGQTKIIEEEAAEPEEEEAEKEPTAHISVSREWLKAVTDMLLTMGGRDVVRVVIGAKSMRFEWGCEWDEALQPFSLALRDHWDWHMHKMWKKLDNDEFITFGLTPAVISRIHHLADVTMSHAWVIVIDYFEDEHRLTLFDDENMASFYVLPADGEYMKHWEGE